MDKRKQKHLKIWTCVGFILIVIGLLFLAFSGDNLVIIKDLFNANISQEEIHDHLSDLDWSAYFAFGVLSMLQVLLTVVPAEPIQVMAGVTFGFWRGSLVCIAGIMVGITVMFLLHKLFSTQMNAYFDENKSSDFDFETAASSSKVAMIILILACLPAIPYGVICLFASGLNVKYPKYLLLTTIGFIPSVFVDVALGHVAIASSWIISLVVFVVIIIVLIIMNKKKDLVFKKVNDFVRRKSAPFSSKTKVRKPNKFLYGFIAFLSKFAFDSKMKVKLENKVGKLERPAIVLCNHGSFFDFVYSSRLLIKDKPNFVVARLYFYHRWLGKLLRKVGGFPKSMFSSDIGNAKNCMRVLGDNGVLCMMPEARLSTAGKFEGIQDTTYKFLQRSNVAVYSLKIHGAYFAKPKWGKKMRKRGLVEASISPLFNAGELKTMPIEEIKAKVEQALYYNEFEWLEQHPEVHYKSKYMAEGLENILSLCPDCKAKYSMKAKGNAITCEKCGTTRTINDRYGFNEPPFDNLLSWYEYNKTEMEKQMRENPDFALTQKVKLMHASKTGKTMLRQAGEGVCVLDKTGLTYRGTDDDKEVEKVFPLADIYRILFGAGEDFELYDGEEIYYFVPEELRSCVDWYTASELLEKIYK